MHRVCVNTSLSHEEISGNTKDFKKVNLKHNNKYDTTRIQLVQQI